MIGLSLLPTGHPPSFQPRWVRPSTGSYPRFSLPMGSSPGFASAQRDSTPCSDSLSLRLGHPLTSPRGATRWLILQKARRHTSKGAPTACRQAVSGTVSLPSRGAFHLSLLVLCAIGRYLCFALEGGPPCFPRGFSCPAVLWIPSPKIPFSPTRLSLSSARLPRRFG